MREQAPLRASALASYRTHILEAIGEDAIVCLECGGLYQALPNHLRLTHALPVEEYKAKWGYNRSTGLYCRVLAERFRAQDEHQDRQPGTALCSQAPRRAAVTQWRVVPLRT